MAFPVRVLHPLLLAILGLSLVTYSSYYASTGLFQSTAPDPSRILIMSSSETASSAANVTSSSVVTQSAITANTTPVVEPVSNVTTTRHIAFQVIQRIPPKQPIVTASDSSNGTLDHTDKGILTRYLYESGFVIPNIEICPELGKNMQLLVAVTSAPSHKSARMAIRQTWGHYKMRNDVNIAFLLGATKDRQLAQELKEEQDLYGDLICAHFLDSYNNLTLKTVSLLEWVDNYCNGVKYILKTDDDMFINIPKLLSFIEKHAKDKRTIFGRLAKKWKPIRNKKSKYYISPNQYRLAAFPDFTTGPAYLMTGDVVHDLFTAALSKTYLKLEDVFVTGIVAQDAKVRRIHINEFLNKRVTFNACNIQKGISIHMVKFHEQFDLWKKLLDGKSKCK